MNLYHLKSNQLIEIRSNTFELEKEIQNIIEKNVEELFSLEFIKTEFQINEYRIDSLCFDNQTKSFVIIEYKRGSSYSVIDQGYTYLNTVLENKSECVLEYNETKNKQLKRSDVDWSATKVIFISSHFNDFQKSCLIKNLPIDLYEIKRFEKDVITIQKIKNNSKQNSENFSRKDRVVKKINEEIKVYSEEDHTEKSNDRIKNIWYELKQRLLRYEDTDFNAKKGYIQFHKNNKGVCYIKLRKDCIRVDFITGVTYKDGTKSSTTIKLNDPKNMGTKKTINWKGGDIGHRYNVEIRELDEIDDLEPIIRQKYKIV